MVGTSSCVTWLVVHVCAHIVVVSSVELMSYRKYALLLSMLYFVFSFFLLYMTHFVIITHNYVCSEIFMWVSIFLVACSSDKNTKCVFRLHSDTCG